MKRFVPPTVTPPGRPLGVLASAREVRRNVLGIMPHPERAADPRTGGTDGLPLLRALVEAFG